LTGRVPNLQIADQAASMAAPYGKVLNFLEISGGQQVCLEVKFAEVSRSASNHLGVNLGFSDGTSFGGSNIGQVNPSGILPVGAADVALAIVSPNPAVTLFGKGVLGQTAFAYFVDALRQNNLLRVLAEPNLMAISGQEASFLAGGEYPIPVTQGGGTGAGGTAVTVEYREFGVKLKMTPVVLGDGKIRLKVAPEVSDLDFSTAVRFNGFVIPGLTSRKVETVIELNEGQTFAIAGLLNNNMTASKDVTPLLGDLPVVGALFRSVRYQRKETELVVLVTPRLVNGMNPDQVPALPGESWREPNELDMYLNADIGGPATDVKNGTPRPAPRYHGMHGYAYDEQPVATKPTEK
jgi:pilus assembly protein CpaC